MLFAKSRFWFLFAVFVTLAGCKTDIVRWRQEPWGMSQNRQVYLYTLTNKNGMVVKMTNYGAIITSIMVPDKRGKLEDVVLGFDNLKQYTEPNPCFGAVIGRYANRIKNATFTINDSVYHLTKNDGNNCSHGGYEFNTAVWWAKKIETKDGAGIKFGYISADGSNGFPGNLNATVTYLLTDSNSVNIHYEATTDKPTHVNFTQHSYFNLTGCNEPVYGHSILIDADNYTEIDQEIVPTGVISTVAGTLWDLTRLTPIGDNIRKLDFNGYHYCYVFNKTAGQLKKVIEVVEPKSGRTLEVSTTQPGVQFYSGNSIPDTIVGKYGITYRPHMAFCIETQHFPDSPNHSNFPSTLLLPQGKYDQTVIYHFGLIKEPLQVVK